MVTFTPKNARGINNYVRKCMRALSSEALSGAFMSSLLGIIGVSVNLKMSSFSANLKKKSQDCSLFVHRKGAAVVYNIIIL